MADDLSKRRFLLAATTAADGATALQKVDFELTYDGNDYLITEIK